MISLFDKLYTILLLFFLWLYCIEYGFTRMNIVLLTALYRNPRITQSTFVIFSMVLLLARYIDSPDETYNYLSLRELVAFDLIVIRWTGAGQVRPHTAVSLTPFSDPKLISGATAILIRTVSRHVAQTSFSALRGGGFGNQSAQSDESLAQYY